MNRIKELRKKFGIKQIDLCRKLCVSQGTLSLWENNKFEPDQKSIFYLCELFGVSSDYLLGRLQTEDAGHQKEKMPIGFPTDTDSLNKDLKMIGFTSADYDALPDPEKQALITTIKSLAESFKKNKK